MQDGSNSFLDTSNVLLWGGTKSLMGYAKHHLHQLMVYVDYSPALHAPAAQRVGWSAPQSKPPMCSGLIVPTPAGREEAWQNNSCIASDPAHFFRWFSCNASNPLDGGAPAPLSDNNYFSASAGYVLNCGGASWNLSEAQARGLDLRSSLHPLPTLEGLLGMIRALLEF